MRSDLKESKEGGLPSKRTGKSIPCRGPKTEMAQELTVELIQGIWGLRVSEAEQAVQESM